MVVGIEMLCSRDVTTAVCLRQYAKMLKLSSPESGRKRRHLIEADSNLSFATTFVKGPSASAALHVPLPTHNASSYRSVVEQIFQDRSRAAGALLASEIDVGRHARPAVPELVCGISR